MLQQSQLPIDDFSGGITDYTLSAQPNQHQEIDNLLINPNKKLLQAPGSVIFDSLMYQIPSGNQRIAALFPSIALSTLLINSGREIWYPNTTFTAYVGPTGNNAFDLGTSASFTAYAEYGEVVYATSDALALPIKMYKDGSGVKQLRTAGLPPLASTPTVVSSGGVGVNNYLYAFAYYYTYTVGSVVFEDNGPVTYYELNLVNAPSVNQVNISVIPVVANGTTLNYDTTNLKVKIYRTINNGLVLYEIGSVTNGTTTFVDNQTDASISDNNAFLYTTGGVLDNDPPPRSKYITIVNGIAYYGHVQEGAEVFKNRVRQSIQDDPDSCPQVCYADFLDEVVGLSSFNDNLIVFTKGHVYRLNGYINELGQGQISFEDITKTIGCKNHNGIVQTRFGVFWCGDDGFYWTDAFNFKKISDSLNESYKLLVSSESKQSRMYGTFDKVDNRVIWAVQFEESASDNDTFFTLDLRWGMNDASTFTTRTNGNDFAPTAICYYNSQLLRADRRGYLFKHSDDYRTDPKVVTSVAATLWGEKAIIVNYISAVQNFGLPSVRKWVPKVLLTLENKTNAYIQLYSINDNTGTSVPLLQVRFTDNVPWGDPTPIWGAELPLWNSFNLIEQMRRFPSGGLRCSYKQIQMTNAYANIYNSDTVGVATVDSTLKTATLSVAAMTWPTDVVDYYISFEDDDYTEDLLITSIPSSTVVTFLDPLNVSVTGSKKWLVRGYAKGQKMNPLSFVVYFSPLTDQSYRTYRSEQDSDGTNA